ncbi:hypothetical protein [Sporosarcina sp. PTS2304]|uniref:hypothetical protein n=1 Tax=Sporosarcina sp. PTS2304 TaxID=2283194 RepID=UPI001F074418|nr:hypothetical protein [Sporosarcina sp. PTS2304]
MIKKLDITKKATTDSVLQIQLLSYQVEAKIIEFDDIPPLKDTIETLSSCGETFFGYYVQEELSGVISYKLDEHTTIFTG